MSKIIDLTGQKFGKLTVIKVDENNHKRNQKHWLCKCDCGNITSVCTNKLKSGHTKSCGCYSREKAKKVNTTHGLSKEPLYERYMGMKARCYNTNHESYKDYGGRGITVCDEWLNNYESFREWAMDNGYEPQYKLDRRDNDGNYEPSNCRWISHKSNMRNTRHNVYIDGELLTDVIRDVSLETNRTESAIWTRYYILKKKGITITKNNLINYNKK